MATLIVVSFPEEKLAFDLRASLVQLQKEYLIEMEDVVIVTKDADGKIVKSDVMSLMSKMRAGVIGEDAEQSVSQSMNDMFSSSGMSSTQSQFVVWQEMLPGGCICSQL